MRWRYLPTRAMSAGGAGSPLSAFPLEDDARPLVCRTATLRMSSTYHVALDNVTVLLRHKPVRVERYNRQLHCRQRQPKSTTAVQYPDMAPKIIGGGRSGMRSNAAGNSFIPVRYPLQLLPGLRSNHHPFSQKAYRLMNPKTLIQPRTYHRD